MAFNSVWIRFIYFVLVLSFISSCASKRTVSTSKNYPNNKSQKTTSNSSINNKKPTSIAGIDYINRYKDIAVSEMNRFGIPASIKLAQALLESGNGNSYLAVQANNHFGIKCGGGWNGKSVRRADDSPNDCFRVYDNPEQSFKDHSQFLLRTRYEKLFTLNKNDYKGWAKGLKEAGYATNPRYPELLIDLIERYELFKYDQAENKSDKIFREVKIETTIEAKEKEEKGESVVIEQIKSPVKMVIHEVAANHTLYSIGKQYSVTVDQIKLLNNLSSDNLSVGQLLVITK